jgi:hypothetical protein
MNEQHLKLPLSLSPLKGLIAASLSVCLATAAQANPSDFEQGWRQAKVVSLLEGADPAPAHVHMDCRQASGAKGSTRYVAVSHSFGGNPNLRRTLIVPVAGEATVKVGDALRVNVNDCQASAR